jgi:CheY-like chemotaxis protein
LRKERGELALAAKILVVDDEPAIRELAQMILGDNGYSVVTAKDGTDALRKADEEMPDLIFLDVVMPGISGLEVCRILKSQAKTKSIPIVMFTVLGRNNDVKAAEAAQCDGYFLKPFTPESILAEAKRCLNASQPKPIK